MLPIVLWVSKTLKSLHTDKPDSRGQLLTLKIVAAMKLKLFLNVVILFFNDLKFLLQYPILEEVKIKSQWPLSQDFRSVGTDTCEGV